MKIYAAFLILLLPCFTNAQTVFVPKTEAKILSDTLVLFDFGKYDLRPESVALLDALSNEIKNLKKIRVEVTAHTDSIGSI